MRKKVKDTPEVVEENEKESLVVSKEENSLAEAFDVEKLEKIREYREEGKKDKKEEKKSKTIALKKELLRNSLIALGFQLYFFLTGVFIFYVDQIVQINMLVIGVVLFVIGGIVMLELSYRKEKVRLAFTGAELLGMAASSLVLYNLIGRYSPQTKLALIVMQSIMLGYFVIKALIMFIMRKKGKI